MGSDRIRAEGTKSSSLIPGNKPKQFSYLQPRYRDRVETDSVQGDQQPENPTPVLGHSFGRMSVRPIQAKLTIGQPNDKYEQEADRVASQVVQQINAPSTAQSTQGQSVQRMDELEEEELQTKPIISPIQRSLMSPVVQRATHPIELMLQRREAIASGEASTDLDSAINSARGSGKPLEEGLQKSMGQAMGADFSRVRVHTDAQSDQLNQSIQARAFTTGQDVFFQQEAYEPRSRGGQELIAHELTHVVQQNGRAVKPTVQMKGNENTNAQKVLEKEADLDKSGSALKHEASPEERKEAAKNKFISLMEAKKDMNREEIEGVLVQLKTEFQLSDVKLEGSLSNPKIGFYASPAQFLPLTIVPVPVGSIGPAAPAPPRSGKKLGVGAKPSVIAGDYIKATRYDGPFPTPGKEVVTQFNNRFQGERYTNKRDHAGNYVNLVGPINANALPLHTKKQNNNYRRAGIVEAKSSVTRGPGRSGQGETIFGHFGADEEMILTGKRNTNYNGGHLVGDQIMDSHQAFNLYEDWNLAPQQRNFNSPIYSNTVETPVTNAIKNMGETIKYEVTVQYPDDTYQIKPSNLIKNLFGPKDMYRQEVEGAIKIDGSLDANFTFRRRTPGFWQAEAEVIGGGKTIKSGKTRSRLDIAFENAPVNVQPGVNYKPVAPEQVRYSLEIDQGFGAGWQAQVGPTPGKPLVYAGATKVRETARQQTF